MFCCFFLTKLINYIIKLKQQKIFNLFSKLFENGISKKIFINQNGILFEAPF